MEEQKNPLTEEQIELYLSELLNVFKLYVTETVDQFATNVVEGIVYPCAPAQVVEVERKFELNTAVGAIITTRLNDPKSQWEYKDVEGVTYNSSTIAKRFMNPRLCTNVHWNGTIITYVT